MTVDTKTLCNNRFLSSIKPLFSAKISSKDKTILIEKDEKQKKKKLQKMTRWLHKSLGINNVISNLNLPQYIDPLISTENVQDPDFEAK